MIDEKELHGLKDVERRLEEENHLIGERIRKLNELKDLGIDPYPHNFKKTHSSKDLKEKYNHLNAQDVTQDEVSIAGRITSFRRIGKVTFAHISDNDGKMQVLFNDAETKNYDILKLLDMGDYVGISGIVLKTKTGELSVKCKEYKVLAKSLRPLPEKYHGIQDVEIKYRQRYLDLIMDENSKKVFVMRTKIIKALREFLDNKEFMEVENPTLQPVYGGAAARPFITHHNDLDMKLYLRISLELYLKKLIIGGYERVYEIGKVFRNEGIDTTHNPEFTMMECYFAYADYNDVMELVEDAYNYIALKVLGTTTVTYQDKVIELKKPWARLTMKDAIKQFGQIDVDKLTNEDIIAILKENKIEYKHDMTRGLLINQLFKIVEEKLIQPVFIIDHPKETTPLCKLHRKDHSLIERFEAYINGWEICNAYTELNDPIRQRYLLEEQAKNLRGGDEESNPMDEDFCRAVEYGMPPMGGLGIGIDRMTMIMTNTASIRDVLFFPTMKNIEEK